MTSRPALILSAALLGAALFASAPEASAWGARTHEIINRRAIDRLPEPARTAWAPLAASLGSHASDADHRKGSDPDEPPRHYIDIDAYDEPPFDRVERDLDVLRRRRGSEAVAKWGVAPWAVEECWRMTVRSLELGDWGSAGAWAADLGHYVADTHQPLHCTINYDGQRTGNRGVHLRYEVHMMDRFYRETSLDTAPPRPVAAELEAAPDDPLELCFDWIAEAHAGLDVVIRGDDAAVAVDPAYGDRYYEALWPLTGGAAGVHVARAVADYAALLQSAWEAAGSPPGPTEAPPLRALPPDLLAGPPKADRKASRAALALAGGLILGALVLAGS